MHHICHAAPRLACPTTAGGSTYLASPPAVSPLSPHAYDRCLPQHRSPLHQHCPGAAAAVLCPCPFPADTGTSPRVQPPENILSCRSWSFRPRERLRHPHSCPGPWGAVRSRLEILPTRRHPQAAAACSRIVLGPLDGEPRGKRGS